MKRFILSISAVLAVADAAHARPDYAGAGGAIPDFDPPSGNPGVLLSTITVNDNFLISDVNVTLTSLTHTWSGDLIIQLEKIGGPTAILVSRVGSVGGTFGASADYNGNYAFDSQSANNIWDAAMGSPTVAAIPAGIYTTSGPGVAPPFGAPNNSLNAFNGLNAMGQWRLTITDTSSVDTGSLGGWTLTIVPGPASLGVFAAALFLRPRRGRKPSSGTHVAHAPVQTRPSCGGVDEPRSVQVAAFQRVSVRSMPRQGSGHWRASTMTGWR